MQIIAIFRTILFFLGQITSLIAFSVLSIFVWPFSTKVRYKYMRLWSVFCILWLKWTCGISYEVHGSENIDKTQTGLVLARHESAWETFALQDIFPWQSFVLKKELLIIPFFGWGLAMLNPIAIDRKSAIKSLRQVITEGTERLNKGTWVIIFPEGTRMPAGKLGKINSGGAMLAIKAQKPVYLVAHDAGKYWPKNNLVKTPGKINIYISKPIDVTNMTVVQLNKLTEEWFSKHFSN